MTQSLTFRSAALGLTLTIAFIPTLATPAFADYDAGLAAYNRGDYAAASREWLPLAENGNAKAQNALGVIYAKDQGFPQDYGEAVKWYRKAADGGYLNAMHNLGFMYANGQGLQKNLGEAVKWYRKAAEGGHHDSQHSLARSYAEGKGVPQDDVQAYTWLLITNCSHTEALKSRKEIAARLTAEQISEAKNKASQWKPKKQESGKTGITP